MFVQLNAHPEVGIAAKKLQSCKSVLRNTLIQMMKDMSASSCWELH